MHIIYQVFRVPCYKILTVEYMNDKIIEEQLSIIKMNMFSFIYNVVCKRMLPRDHLSFLLSKFILKICLK